MSIRRACFLLALTALASLNAGVARAEMADFSYSWMAQPSSVITSGTGSVTLATAADGTASAELASPSPVFIPGATVTTTSSATIPADSFDTPFSMKLTLTDTLSGQSGVLTFAGHLAGTLSADTSTLTSTFTTGVTQTLMLGMHEYTVTIDPALLNLPAPGSTAQAMIDARVMVRLHNGNIGGNPDPTPHQTPEPTGLALAVVGLAGAALRRWRKA